MRYMGVGEEIGDTCEQKRGAGVGKVQDIESNKPAVQAADADPSR